MMEEHIKILIPYDFSGAAEAALEYVNVLTVKDPDNNFGYRRDHVANDTATAYYLEEFYSHHAFIEGEDLGKAIFEYTNEQEIDLMAILPGNHARNIRRSEGRLTRHL